MKQFPPFSIDEVNQCVHRNATVVPLTPKAFSLLGHLVNNSGRLITKEELLDAVWRDTFVQEAVLKVAILELRKALGDDARNPRFIETVHKRGYRFCASVTETAAAQPPPNNARVFGRNPEMESLRALWKDACNGNRRIVLIAGEAGIGKSTLVQHFLYTVPHGNVRIARGQCVEHFGEPEPYYPVLDACSRLARESGGTAVAEVLRQFAPTWLLQLPSIASSEDFQLLRAHVVGATKERMLREIADAINVLSSVDPVILVLEDLHWADSATVDLLSWIASKQDPARLLVIGTYRPVDAILS
ncbi:MAG: AAA family ATPase, partial [Bryobacteraceae bacterium]|nr:AAA family ATPase [Bryobacteraceae bacterium]